jgi:hypothetical protein
MQQVAEVVLVCVPAALFGRKLQTRHLRRTNGGVCMPNVPETEFPYFVKIETSTGQTTTVPIAFMTPKQIENFLQVDFKRLVQEAGAKGARIYVERATTADYEKVLGDIAACLRTAGKKAA